MIGEEEYYIDSDEEKFTSELYLYIIICVLVIQKYTVTFYSCRCF